MQTISLQPAARGKLRQAIDVARRDVDTSTTGGTLLAGHRAATLVPWDSQVHELRLVSRTDATLITGLPVPEEDDADAAHVLQTAVAALAGVGLPWNWHGQGPVYQDIVARPGAPANTNATADDFGAHQDDMALGHLSPQVILLSARNNVAGSKTGWISANRLLENMPRAFMTEARSARWMLRAPLSLGLGEVWVGPMPLVKGPEANGTFEACLATYAVRHADADSRLGIGVIEWLREQAMDRMAWIDIQPGSLLVIPNRLGLHARQAIRGDRVMLRTYANTDLSAHRRVAAIVGELLLFDACKALRACWPGQFAQRALEVVAS
jgi:hypothetical protein